MAVKCVKCGWNDAVTGSALCPVCMPDVLFFLKMIRDDFDCDQAAHDYGTVCRCCEAERILNEIKAATRAQEAQQDDK